MGHARSRMYEYNVQTQCKANVIYMNLYSYVYMTPPEVI